MNVNNRGAAANAFCGVKQIIDIADNPEAYESAEEMGAAIMEVAVKYQPQLAAYCLLEHFEALEGEG